MIIPQIHIIVVIDVVCCKWNDNQYKQTKDYYHPDYYYGDINPSHKYIFASNTIALRNRIFSHLRW